MGLDQYAFRDDGAGRSEIAYWRKHNRLQGWMASLYAEKGGTEEFNCLDLELEGKDLDALEVAIQQRVLPATVGFFYGNDSYDDYDSDDGYKVDDEAFIEKGRKVLADGHRLIYFCWW